MKMTKSLLPLLMITIFPFVSFSQNEWNSTNSSTKNMFRKGYVAIGTSQASTTIPFIVQSATAPLAGTHVLFGGTAMLGTVAATNSVLQIQSANTSSLQLLGSIQTTNNSSAIMDISSAGLELKYRTTTANPIPFIITGNGSEDMRIWPNGSVGIGTGTTALGTCKLAVDGLIGCRELKVTLATTWPDYVFDENYKHKNVYELQEFISKNKHLPYMKSEKEIGNEFNVGETQVDMLRSLEELYLIVIDLKKENDLLKKQVEKLTIGK